MWRAANFSVNDLDGLMLDLAEVAELPDDVAEEMLLAEAEIVEEAQVSAGKAMGVYDTGQTLASIGHGKMKLGRGGGRTLYVYPRGVNDKGVRNAEVAFINEFGAPKRGIPARPFVAAACESAADAAVEAAAKIYDKYLKSKNL